MIPDYDPPVAKGSIRGVNEIYYAWWQCKTQWLHGHDYKLQSAGGNARGLHALP